MTPEPNAADKYHDGNERDVASKQEDSIEESEALQQDPDLDAGAVNVLPGTGGPDDVGDIELDPGSYSRDGHATPMTDED